MEDVPQALPEEHVAQLESALKAAGAGKVLNPKGLTWFGMVGPGQNRVVHCRGLWRPEKGQPVWGPEGDPSTHFFGANKWCVLIMAKDLANQSTLYVLPYRGAPLNCPGIDANGTHLYALMNDDPGKFGDNESHETDPMRVW